jgi:predicted nucleic acid-binding protein
VICYADSSAVLAWLLGEPPGATIEAILGGTDQVIASDLTLIECDRVLLRLAWMDPMARPAVEALRARLAEAMSGWNLQPISETVVERARQPFPDDSLRSLDAIHLATAVVARLSVHEIHVLSLDERVRANAAALGFRVRPA